MRVVIFIIICTALLGACAAPGRDVQVDLPLVIPDALYPELSSKVSREPAQSRVISFSKTLTLDNKGNFGMLAYTHQQQLFSFRQDGLLQVQTTASFQGPGGISKSVDQTLSLCGLVPVLGEAAGLSNSAMATAASAGGAFLPLNFSLSLQSATRRRLSRLEVDSSNLCQPTPGMEFSIQMESEIQSKANGQVYSSNKQFTLTEQAKCKVGSDLLPASDLNSSMRGQYLAVSCAYTAEPSNDRKVEYAFLLASGMYVGMGEVAKWQTDKARYESVKYQSE
ncbi:hypothetical protein [Polaromonas aquatica]|uniref:hypothetical protein n=1 Tax=Polaromonas aquatica TaxID=332657 RepID=UPI003D649FF6